MAFLPPSLAPPSSMSLDTIWLISQHSNSTICMGSPGSKERGRWSGVLEFEFLLVNTFTRYPFFSTPTRHSFSSVSRHLQFLIHTRFLLEQICLLPPGVSICRHLCFHLCPAKSVSTSLSHSLSPNDSSHVSEPPFPLEFYMILKIVFSF